MIFGFGEVYKYEFIGWGMDGIFWSRYGYLVWEGVGIEFFWVDR